MWSNTAHTHTDFHTVVSMYVIKLSFDVSMSRKWLRYSTIRMKLIYGMEISLEFPTLHASRSKHYTGLFFPSVWMNISNLYPNILILHSMYLKQSQKIQGKLNYIATCILCSWYSHLLVPISPAESTNLGIPQVAVGAHAFWRTAIINVS